MTLETLLWLLPAVFMFHDFEEIIMVRPWMQKNAPLLRSRFPKLVERVLPHAEKLSASGFALAVAEEFIILTVLTYATVEYQLYAMWTGMMLGFFVHLFAHVGQFLILKKYTPGVLTSMPVGIYCIYALRVMKTTGLAVWNEVLLWLVVALVILIINLLFAHRLGAKFDEFLNRHFSQSTKEFG